MKLDKNTMRLLVALALCGAMLAGEASAQITAPGLVKDINANPSGSPALLPDDGANFDPGHNLFASAGGAPYQVDDEAILNGNNILVTTQNGVSAFDGLGFTLSISNGENGDGLDPDLGNGVIGTDPSNPNPVDPAIAALGNSSGRLEDGNVIRFSVWVRQDPTNPLTVEPQIVPIVKLEFWRDAFSSFADNTGGVTNPSFGRRIFDTDQNSAAGPSESGRVLDIDGDGLWSFGSTTEPAPTNAWQQIVHTYEVDSIGEGWDITDSFDIEDVSFVEEIRAVMFMGDFTGNDLGGPGSLFWDNALLEVFADTSAESASDVTVSNPTPLLDEQPGDFDGDGDVDVADAIIGQQNGFDLTASGDWNPNFGAGEQPGSAVSAVPEPSALLIGVSAALGLLARRSRKEA